MQFNLQLALDQNSIFAEQSAVLKNIGFDSSMQKCHNPRSIFSSILFLYLLATFECFV